jgi:hypothetical protein
MSAPNPIEVQRHLSGVDYPASRDDLVTTAQNDGAPDDVVEALRALPDREYDSPTDVSSAVADR